MSFSRFRWTRVPNQLYYFRGSTGKTRMSRDLSKRPTTDGASISATPKIDQQTLAEMMPEVYEELRRLAASYLRKERTEHTLQRTALVHEAYLRLAGQHEGAVWRDRAHFFASFSRIMRQNLTTYCLARAPKKMEGRR